MIGTTVGSYCITAKVSVGGMGTVYKAEHTLLGKLAAVKVLHPDLRSNRDVVNRFFNEAKATTQIKHPGIVEVFDFDYLPSGDGYIVMEFLEGMSLARRLKLRGKMGEGEAAMLLRAVCSALAAAHAKQIVHRDLKPDNIFLVPDADAPTGERPKLLDFGIAKLSDAGLTGEGSTTKTGAVMGTPTYMSPEQCKGNGDVDLRADLYALGCIFYELVCGRPPFTNMGAGELIGAHLYIQPDPPSVHLPSISPESEQLILELLSKKPAERPQTARALGERFSRLAQQHGWITHTSPTGIRKVSEDDLVEIEVSTTVRDASEPPVDPSARTSALEYAPPPLTISSQPTTLSGAASQSVVNVPRSRVGLWIAGITAVGFAAGAAILLTTGGDHANHRAATKAPAPTSPAPPAAPATAAPATAAPATAAPATAAPAAPAPVTQPAPATPAAAPAPAPAPALSAAPTPAATPGKRSTGHPHGAVGKPVDPKLTRPAEPKPAAGSGSGKILIETDL